MPVQHDLEFPPQHLVDIVLRHQTTRHLQSRLPLIHQQLLTQTLPQIYVYRQNRLSLGQRLLYYLACVQGRFTLVRCLIFAGLFRLRYLTVTNCLLTLDLLQQLLSDLLRHAPRSQPDRPLCLHNSHFALASPPLLGKAQPLLNHSHLILLLLRHLTRLINYLDIACPPQLLLTALVIPIPTPIQNPIHPQSQIVLIDLKPARFSYHYLEARIYDHPLTISHSLLFLRVQFGRIVVVDVSQKLQQVSARNSAVCTALQLLPDTHQIFLVLYLTQIVQLLHYLERLFDTQKTLGLTQMRVIAMVQLVNQSAELLLEFACLDLLGTRRPLIPFRTLPLTRLIDTFPHFLGLPRPDAPLLLATPTSASLIQLL